MLWRSRFLAVLLLAVIAAAVVPTAPAFEAANPQTKKARRGDTAKAAGASRPAQTETARPAHTEKAAEAGHTNVVFQIAIAMLAATLFAFVAKLVRQPLIIGYMAAGVLIGKTQGLGWIDTHDIEPISELGLILLLFMIGLEIDLKKLRDSGKTVVAAGVGQVAICFALGLAAAPLLGFSYGEGNYNALYLAFALSLSSTMIVVKILYDKSELDTIAGRITLGVLVFQDIAAILFLAVQPNLKNPAPFQMFGSLLQGIGLVFVAFAISKFWLPRLFRSIAKMPELMVLGALGWCFGISMLAAQLGLSREMGALIAGVAISTFPYNLEVIAKIISLRDFFITLFFVSLGTRIPQPDAGILVLAGAASVFLIASRFLSLTPILVWLRNGNRASFIPALNLSQISEFSLVICALGVSMGHIETQVLSLVVFILVITSVTSTYGILYNHEVFDALNPWLKKLGVRDLDEETIQATMALPKPIVFLGFAHSASSLLHELLRSDPDMAKDIAVVDFNPQVKQELDRRRIKCFYGDIGHADTLHHADIHEARVVLSTLPDNLLKGTSNSRLLQQVKALAPEAQVIVTAQRFDQAKALYGEGASFVYIPRIMSVRDLRGVVIAALAGTLEDERQAASAELEAREEVLP